MNQRKRSIRERLVYGLLELLPTTVLVGGFLAYHQIYPHIRRGVPDEIYSAGKIAVVRQDTRTIMDINSDGSPDYTAEWVSRTFPILGYFPGVGYVQGHDIRRPTPEEIIMYKNSNKEIIDRTNNAS